MKTTSTARTLAVRWLLPVAVCVLVAAAVHVTSKTESPPPTRAWSAPTVVTDLLSEKTRTLSSIPPRKTRSIAAWDAKQIAARWQKSKQKTGTVFVSPRIPSGVSPLEELRLTVRPGRATTLRFLPKFHWPTTGQGRGLEATDLRYRTVSIPLASLTADGESVDLTIPLRELLYGNWGDQKTPHGLSLSFALAFEEKEAAAQAPAVLSASLFDRDAIRNQAQEGVGQAEFNGVLRPAWLVRTGNALRLEVELDSVSRELRWYEGAEQSGSRRVELTSAGQTHLLSRSDGDGGWVLCSASLEKWKGKTVSLEFRVEAKPGQGPGAGRGYFANPSIVPNSLDAQAPDVLVYLIDTLRADRIGAWGHEKARTPTLDRLAASGTVFRNAISSSPWTKPAIPTLMSGIWPTTHRVGARMHTDLMPDGVPLVQERFRDAGWRTASFSANPLGSTLSALDRGFSATHPPRHWEGTLGERSFPSAQQLHRSLMQWVDEQADRPFMAYVQTLEVHEWRDPGRENPNKQQRDQLYDAAVARADTALGELLVQLSGKKRKRPLLVVVVSDHGESLGEHEWVGHGYTLYQPEVHVPLVFWATAGLPKRSFEPPVSLADVAPTLLDLVGLEPLPSIHGVSLAPNIDGRKHAARSYAPSALLRFVHNPSAPRQFALVDETLTKVVHVEEQSTVFNLQSDNAEQKPVTDKPGIVQSLKAWLTQQTRDVQEFEKRFGETGQGELDPQQLERLKSLGYVGQ